MRPEDTVLGIEINGDARAYPWWIVDSFHVANDVVGGRPVVISLCEACSSATAFDPIVDGKRLTFQFSHVFKGTPAMSDRETQSVWSTFLDVCVQGQLEGRRLEMLPLVQTEWVDWLRLHPDTVVLADGIGSRTGHGSDHSIGSPEVPDLFARTVDHWDKRIAHNTLVLGVVSAEVRRAYPLRSLGEFEGVVNDELGGVPIVVFSDGVYAALAFSRALDGQVLTFVTGESGPVDEQTGSRWGYDGTASAGPLAGQALDYIRGHVSEWYVWAAHYPGIELFDGSTAAR